MEPMWITIYKAQLLSQQCLYSLQLTAKTLVLFFFFCFILIALLKHLGYKIVHCWVKSYNVYQCTLLFSTTNFLVLFLSFVLSSFLYFLRLTLLSFLLSSSLPFLPSFLSLFLSFLSLFLCIIMEKF